MSTNGWYGFDFDGTLCTYDTGMWPKLGEPVPEMVNLVKQMLAEGREVRIVTARSNFRTQIDAIKDWLEANGLPRLEVTDKKDYEMICLYDDRAIQVIKNTGQIAVEEAYNRGHDEGYNEGYDKGYDSATRNFQEWLDLHS